MHHRLSRRSFLGTMSVGSAALLNPCPQMVFAYEANEKLNIALIGIGGRGRWFVDTMPKLANVVALCDVNEKRAGDGFEQIPQAKKYADFRRMLEEMDQQIDGVVIATPDHTHAVAAAMAMRMGKHVYCEKPLTHSIHEARFLRQLANETNVATQMGNQGTASAGLRRALAWIRAGVIGEIREVHGWNDAGGKGPSPLPSQAEPVPATLQWDLWLGPAADRPYNRQWMNWHAWRDFGTGQLGNWAVHSLNLAFMALRLNSLWGADPTVGAEQPAGTIKIRTDASARHGGTFPRWELVRWDFPARESLPPVTVHWHNGANPMGTRKTIEDLLGRPLDWGDHGERKWRDHAGTLIVGTKGMIHANGHNTEVTLLPKERFSNQPDVPQVLPNSPSHEQEWLDACRGGPAAVSNFNYGGPLTEFLLTGNIATQIAEELEFDPAAGTFVNNDRANSLLHREYRKGWRLE
ncbi:MAG: Gfo/Idh/MocA family oxidoreductase [Pirellulaceae bacterium]